MNERCICGKGCAGPGACGCHASGCSCNTERPKQTMRQRALLADEEIIVGHVILEPGAKMAVEVHAAMSETITVLRGEIDITGIDLTWLCEYGIVTRMGQIALGPGLEQAHIEAGHPHAIENLLSRPAEFIAIMRKVSP